MSTQKVYVEYGATISVSREPPQFIKVTIGQERHVSNPDDVAAAEKELSDMLQGLVVKRARQFHRKLSTNVQAIRAARAKVYSRRKAQEAEDDYDDTTDDPDDF